VATAVVDQETERPVTEWPFSFELIDVRDMFVDEGYQRPLTTFVDKIKRKFDPALFGTVVLSRRERPRREDKREKFYAVMDGQTRKVAVEELVDDGELDVRLVRVPAIVYFGLTRAEEASLFARLQKERRGIASYHRFRAALVANEKEPKAIHKIVTGIGYEIGVEPTKVSAVAALEKTYRRSPELLERTMLILFEAWGERHVPKGEVIRGMGSFLEKAGDVDDSRLARRLSTVTPADLARRASALREGMGHGGGSDKYMAGAIEAIYRRRV
jgi:hypothetical protein